MRIHWVPMFVVMLLTGAAASLGDQTTVKVTVVEIDLAHGLVTVTGDGFKEAVNARQAEIRFREPSGRTTRKSWADLKPGMHAKVTGYWSGLPTLVTKFVIDTK